LLIEKQQQPNGQYKIAVAKGKEHCSGETEAEADAAFYTHLSSRGP